jgi:hypothetical protein
MKNKVLLIILALSLGFVWISEGAAGQIGYRIRDDVEFAIKPPPGPPSSAMMAADALIGRPLGLATTIVGTAILVPAIPLTLQTGTTGEAAWGLVGRPAGWTFVRPLGHSNPKYEEPGVFSK